MPRITFLFCTGRVEKLRILIFSLRRGRFKIKTLLCCYLYLNSRFFCLMPSQFIAIVTRVLPLNVHCFYEGCRVSFILSVFCKKFWKYERAEKSPDVQGTYIVGTHLCYVKSWKSCMGLKMIYVCQCCRLICMKSANFYHRNHFIRLKASKIRQCNRKLVRSKMN